jgi:REP element-mobilizing transposase RayT
MIIETLRQEQDRIACCVYTYCLMPDHLHYLISSCREGVSVLAFTDQFKGKTTNLSWKLGWHHKLWQPRYYDHIIRKDEDLFIIAKYILENPVRKGLVSTPAEWPWCGTLTPLPI